MSRILMFVQKYKSKIKDIWKRNQKRLPTYIFLFIAGLYLYGFLVHSIVTGIDNVWQKRENDLFTWNPVENVGSIFTVRGIGTTGFLILMYCLSSKKGYNLISKFKITKDKERGFEILSEGTHGTSGWLNKSEIEKILNVSSLNSMTETLFGKLDNGGYVGMKELLGMSKNIMVYGAPGTGKSRGFVMPFIMQAVKRGESMVICDSKAEFYEMYSEYLRNEGYFVRSYNLLDLQASDGWNCLMDSADDVNLVQHIAEVIIRNTSADSEREDFWSKAEKNLLMALIHYVQSLTYPNSDKLLPPEERSLGTIYRLLASTSVAEMDARFRALPPGHPALPPYGIFRQAPHNIWGNIMIGLGSRLNVFQNKLADSITKYNEIDLEEPGKRKCAYFCIISDQDDTYRFLSSMFFSLLFIKLFDFARKSENRRLPVRVNVLMDEFCNIDLPNSKKYLSISRSRNIDIQCVAQSVSQLADRYPRTEWQELVGDCDYQLFWGCNDTMTADFISSQCGNITVRVNSASIPMTPMFSLSSNHARYSQGKNSAGRPLMMPDEIRRLPKDKAILLVRGAKPLMLYKIVPEEHPDFKKLRFCKAVDYVPDWRKRECERQNVISKEDTDKKENTFQIRIKEADIESAEYVPNEEELELHPSINLSKGIDCETLTEVSPEDV